MKRLLAVAVAIFALSGCTTAPDRPPGYALGGEGGEGLAIVSLTLSGKALERVSSFEYGLRAAARLPGGAVERTRHFNSARQHARWAADAGDRDMAARTRVIVKGPASSAPLDVVESGKAIGRLIAIPLPAGEYELHDWKVVEPTTYGRDKLTSVRSTRYRFSVAPGRATYLGNLDLRLTGADTYGVTVANKAPRDLALLAGKLPSVSTEDVDYRPGELLP